MRERGALPRDGDQLRLRLFESVPWDGRDPRGLTRGRNVLFLRQEPPCHEVYSDPAQLEFWPVDGHHRRNAEPILIGAAPLVPESKARRRGRRAGGPAHWLEE